MSKRLDIWRFRTHSWAPHRLLETADWDALSAGARKDSTYFSYRWVALHLVEEWGRHLDHADLLRENMDGALGD